MNLGSEIKKIRIGKGISQNELSQRANMSQARISMVENDKYPDMGQDSIQPILDVLGISYPEICAIAQTTEEQHNMLYQIMDKLNQISYVVAPGNAATLESGPKVIDEFGNTLLLPVEFSPVLTVVLKEAVGEYLIGDVFFFSKIKNPLEIKDTDYLVEETISGTPNVFLATNTEKREKAIGRAIRVLKQL